MRKTLILGPSFADLDRGVNKKKFQATQESTDGKKKSSYYAVPSLPTTSENPTFPISNNWISNRFISRPWNAGSISQNHELLRLLALI